MNQDFDGATSLLRENQQKMNLLLRFSQCFLNGRNPDLIDHLAKDGEIPGTSEHHSDCSSTWMPVLSASRFAQASHARRKLFAPLDLRIRMKYATLPEQSAVI
jgi:hypothetical protein